jgi:hypothetical protein
MWVHREAGHRDAASCEGSGCFWSFWSCCFMPSWLAWLVAWQQPCGNYCVPCVSTLWLHRRPATRRTWPLWLRRSARRRWMCCLPSTLPLTSGTARLAGGGA